MKLDLQRFASGSGKFKVLNRARHKSAASKRNSRNVKIPVDKNGYVIPGDFDF